MKKIIKEYSQSDLEIDISKSGSSIKGNEMKSGGSLSPDFINILGYIFKSGITKGCKVTVTAGNDEWHKKNAPNSLHTKGNAIDLTISDKSCRQSLKNYIDGLKKQYPVSYLDEYEHPSAKSTGGHLHIQYGGTQLKSGDESTGVFTGLTSQSSQPSQDNSFVTTLSNIGKNIFGLNESLSIPLKNQKRNSGTSKKYVMNVIADDKVISPIDGKIVSVKKDGTTNLYTVEISHNYKGNKLVSIISGFNESMVTLGDSVSKNKVIGKIYKNNKLTWEVLNKKGKSVDINSLIEDDKITDDKNSKSSEKSTLLKSMIGLNPVSLALKAGKEILQKESTQKTNVLTEEIQRIKNLMK